MPLQHMNFALLAPPSAAHTNDFSNSKLQRPHPSMFASHSSQPRKHDQSWQLAMKKARFSSGTCRAWKIGIAKSCVIVLDQLEEKSSFVEADEAAVAEEEAEAIEGDTGEGWRGQSTLRNGRMLRSKY